MAGEPVVFTIQDEPNLFVFWCEGCGYMHHIDTKRWTFNGDLVKPTASPSLLINKDRLGDDPRCHIFVRDGQIVYLSDCTHELAGKTVPMTPPPEGSR
jgi:hypothetical protein